MKSFNKVSAVFFDFIVLSLLFYMVSAVTFGLGTLAFYGAGITALIQVHYAESHSQTLLRVFELFKRNIREVVIHTISNLFLILLLLSLFANIDLMLPRLVLTTFLIGFEMLFWYVLFTRKFTFIGYYTLTLTLIIKFFYMQIVLFVGIIVFLFVVYHWLWILLFFPFTFIYLFVLFYASKIRQIETSQSESQKVDYSVVKGV